MFREMIVAGAFLFGGLHTAHAQCQQIVARLSQEIDRTALSSRDADTTLKTLRSRWESADFALETCLDTATAYKGCEDVGKTIIANVLEEDQERRRTLTKWRNLNSQHSNACYGTLTSGAFLNNQEIMTTQIDRYNFLVNATAEIVAQARKRNAQKQALSSLYGAFQPFEMSRADAHARALRIINGQTDNLVLRSKNSVKPQRYTASFSDVTAPIIIFRNAYLSAGSEIQDTVPAMYLEFQYENTERFAQARAERTGQQEIVTVSTRLDRITFTPELFAYHSSRPRHITFRCYSNCVHNLDRRSVSSGSFQTRKTSETIRDLVALQIYMTDKRRDACEQGNSNACFFLGLNTQRGFIVDEDADLAFDLFTKGCGLGSQPACHEVGRSFVLGTGVSENIGQGLQRLKANCEGGFALSCDQLVVYLESDDYGIPADPAAAYKAGQTGCDLGRGMSCSNLAGLISRGIGHPVDPQLAKTLYTRACELGDQYGCRRADK
ncbi:MAG: hypothetical protein CMK09_06225 [Ponticaulis sp.]|nr:hypothetical protein [Ponticaulis sp.]|tara:strand:+ start:14671 stop:16155 length:1485 start_codon:yes stop_codon:yes gene_type:complete